MTLLLKNKLCDMIEDKSIHILGKINVLYLGWCSLDVLTIGFCNGKVVDYEILHRQTLTVDVSTKALDPMVRLFGILLRFVFVFWILYNIEGICQHHWEPTPKSHKVVLFSCIGLSLNNILTFALAT